MMKFKCSFKKQYVDTLFTNSVKSGSFKFDEKVSRVFNDMAHRSIPKYIDIQKFISLYVSQVLQSNINNSMSIVDVGCSVGQTIESITKYIQSIDSCVMPKTNVYVCDISKHMLLQCKKNIEKYKKQWNKIEYLQCDISKKTEYVHMTAKITENNQVVKAVICNFVLQFLQPKIRKQVLQSLWHTLCVGGVLLIGEKICSTHTQTQNVWTHMHYEYKKNNNYTMQQIHTKAKALEGVLQESTEKELLQLMQSLPKAHIENFFSWAAFRCYVLHKIK